jgi:hypothetical protein
MRAAPEELRTHMKWLALREKEVEEVDEINDCFGVEASEFRDTWNRRYSSYCGFFEDTSKFFFCSSKSMESLFNLQLVPRSYCCGRPVACSCPGVVFYYPSTIQDNHNVMFAISRLELMQS